MLDIVFSVIKVIFLFGLTVFVHEFGHFITARKLGLVVDVFSIGFGPAIWKKRVGDVTYQVGLLPFGGFVALPQMEPNGGRSVDAFGVERKLPSVAPWRRIIVSAAGAFGNMLLALLLAYIVFWSGDSFAPAHTNVVGYVATNSPAYAAGLRPGDQVISVTGIKTDGEHVEPAKSVHAWDDLLVECALYNRVILNVERGDASLSIEIPTSEGFGGRSLEGVGSVNYCYILNARPDSSAAAAGIEPGDRIVAFDGITLLSREHLIQLVDANRDRTVEAVIERDGEKQTVELTPEYDKELDRALIGVVFNTLDIRDPITQIKSYSTLIFRFLRALVTPSEARAAAASAGGPLAIFMMFWYAVQSSFLLALSFTALINVNLAILNMLPIPILDGGHIIFALWEMITGKPIHEKVLNILVNVFAALLIGLFLLITFKDVRQLVIPLFRGNAPTETVATNAPPSPLVETNTPSTTP